MTVTEIRELDNAALLVEIDTLKEELFDLRFQQAVGQLQNPARLRDIRKTIDRIKTVITDRTLSDAR